MKASADAETVAAAVGWAGSGAPGVAWPPAVTWGADEAGAEIGPELKVDSGTDDGADDEVGAWTPEDWDALGPW
jgi:hypothetical protein